MSTPIFSTILVPLDFTERNARALEVASALASQNGARVELLHVIETIKGIPFDELQGFYERLETEAREKMRPAVSRLEEAGIAVMAFSVALTGALVWWQRRVARLTGSRVVAADSLHYLSDFLPAAGGMLALGASALFGATILDSLVSLAAAAWLLRGAWSIGGAAVGALMDRAAPPEIEEKITAIVRAFPEIRGFHDLRTRVSGPRVFIQIHIELDGDLTLREAHEIGARLKRRLLEEIPRSDVIVHKDPWRGGG